MNTSLKNNKDPLSDLYNIENTQKILNDEEISLINNIFNEVEEFYQITDIFENALSTNQLNHQQLNKIFKAITKIAYYKTSLKAHKQPKKTLVRTFFELPEIISKKIRFFFLYLTNI
jgi:hypothetical protein